ncbi:M61 family metallopeptidase [Piscinibacter sp.]|uniref:M61 family metallopeptidase n=1 Tax=Piscinibacter sp. TaxID=1903157 RepID=UPI002F42F8AF
MKRLIAALTLLLALAAPPAHAQPLPPTGTAPYPGVMSLSVDVTDLDRKIFRASQTLPVRSGPLVLYHPRWLPGTHSPTGAITEFSGLQIHANGQRLDWKRNTLDVSAFHVTVPPGVTTLTIDFEFVSPLEAATGRVVSTPDMLGLQWDTVLLYPAGYAVSKISVQPRLVLPAGWSFGTALEVASRSGDSVQFKPVSVETLVDSPVFAGKHFQQVDLDPGAREAGRPPVLLNMMADQRVQLAAARPEHLAAHRALVEQADQLFGTRHFARYDFLLALSENFGGIGLEHHQSSENGVKSTYFSEWAKTPVGRDLLAHEYVHSWNGKFRRPVDLWTAHFNTPMQNSLLWVYEGQTQFWGSVLAARCGLLSQSDARDDLAATAAWLDARAGRAWRNLQDTTNEPIISNHRWNKEWRSWQRGADYYDEARLIWLEADMLIREASDGQRSMDDFARAFFGAQAGRPAGDMRALTYSFDDVVRELQRVQPYDWAGFLRQRLDTNATGAPLQGLARAGWKLGFSEQPSDYYKAIETRNKATDFSHSLGFDVSTKDSKLSGVVWGSPAFHAGITPGATVLAVNGREYKADGLKDAITAAKDSGAPIELLVKTGDLYRTMAVSYRGGLRYPKLERIDGTPDRLSEMFAPRQQ